MKKMCFLIAVSGFSLVACQKEQLSKRYSDYKVRSSENDTEWITIKEYNEKISTNVVGQIGDTKGWKDCFYTDRRGALVKGRTCEAAQNHPCTSASGCVSGTF